MRLMGGMGGCESGSGVVECWVGGRDEERKKGRRVRRACRRAWLLCAVCVICRAGSGISDFDRLFEELVDGLWPGVVSGVQGCEIGRGG